MNAGQPLPKRRVITVDISTGPFAQHIDRIAELAGQRISSYVCCVNAHMTVEARAPGFAQVVNAAELATADGMPVVYAMRLLHGVKQPRVAGNDLMPALLEAAAKRGLSVFLYGGTEEVQQLIRDRIAREIPGLRIAGHHAPPFGPLHDMDLDREAERINATGAQVVLVSLGCPKQEKWMGLMHGKVDAVMVGAGGAFLLYAGIDTRAPAWMRRLALEWVYRLWLEPRRLWRRYLVTNTVFLGLLVKALVTPRKD
jgi:N-acetylglucosaminyldiphosphoundecaprenol N-acetyl-beta-D-mannosaminyltransferase